MLQLQLDGRLARCRSHSARRLVGAPEGKGGGERSCVLYQEGRDFAALDLI